MFKFSYKDCLLLFSIRYKLVYIIALVIGVVQILPWNCLGMAQGVRIF